MKKIFLLSVSLALLIGLNACKTGKKAYESGNYYQSVLLSVDKLRSSPKNKKAQASLVQAYPLAVQTLELNNENLLKSNDASKWKLILANYGKINRMYEEILRSPKALELIGTPKNYYAEIENVKKNAAEETYAQALSYLLKGNREDAKRAYYLFQESQSYIANYKDTNEKIEEARIMATLFVMINQDPVPATFAVSGSHFKNKIDEYLHSSEARMNFIEFYTPEEMVTLGIQPSHEVVLRYQDFSIGNVYFKESTENLTKDSVVVATYTREVPATQTKLEKSSADFMGIQGGAIMLDSKDGNGNEKVVICHKADGEGKSQTLEVSASALQAHLNHGDTMGSCEDGGGNTGGDSGNSGDTNTSGNSGSTTNTGSTGNTGNTGSTTNTGTTNTGNSGSTGSTGSTGNTGTTTGTSGNTVTGTTTGNTGTTNNANPNNPGNTTATPSTEVVNVYATVKAKLVVNEKTVTSNALMAMTIYETNRAGRVIKEELFPVEHVWVSKWGYFNGDERALSPEQLKITTQKELAAPTRDETFMLLSEDFYYKVTEALRAFYKNY